MKRAEMSQEQRTALNKRNSKARNEYNQRAYDPLTVRIRSDGGDGFTLEQVRAAASAEGVSLNAWVLEAIKDKL